MEWDYKGSPATKVPDGKIGFVYVTHYSDGSYYIGKKLCVSPRKRKLGKKELAARPDDRHKNYKMVITEHKWRSYEGSSSIKSGYTLVAKEIVAWCNTKAAMTYMEADLQFRTGALFDTQCLNLNILGKFYPSVLDGEEVEYESNISKAK